MRRSREDAAERRRRIVETAARLFRARGITPVSVADLASTLLDSYLSRVHRDHAELGCPVAALCSEVAHGKHADQGCLHQGDVSPS